MKKIPCLLFLLLLSCLLLPSCRLYVPDSDNNLVMMRPGDIQLKDEVIARKKYIEPAKYELNLLRFFKEFFSSLFLKNNQTK